MAFVSYERLYADEDSIPKDWGSISWRVLRKSHYWKMSRDENGTLLSDFLTKEVDGKPNPGFLDRDESVGDGPFVIICGDQGAVACDYGNCPGVSLIKAIGTAIELEANDAQYDIKTFTEKFKCLKLFKNGCYKCVMRP